MTSKPLTPITSKSDMSKSGWLLSKTEASGQIASLTALPISPNWPIDHSFTFIHSSCSRFKINDL